MHSLQKLHIELGHSDRFQMVTCVKPNLTQL